MVPLHRHPLGFPFYKNDNIYDAEIGKDYTPKDADDFKRVMVALTKPQEGRYAFGQATASVYFSALFGAPNGWRLESSGKLTRAYETPEYKDALAFMHDLWTAGVFHPNSLQYVGTGIDASRADYANGKFVIWTDQFGNGWQIFWRQGLALYGYNFNIIPTVLRTRRAETAILHNRRFSGRHDAEESQPRSHQGTAEPLELHGRPLRQPGGSAADVRGQGR